MQALHLPYADTGRFAPLVLDYLEGGAGSREMYVHAPSIASLHAAAAERVFPEEHRAVLTEVLRRQYRGITVHEAVADNLMALAGTEALTVTTGHQLCLLSGPLYVPFKILNAVRLARRLTADLDRPVVPVFWMATEDHDRAEIDHAWINGAKVQWPGESAGAVGRMKLDGIDAFVKEAMEAIGPGAHAAEIRDLVARCYRPDHTLAQATRLLVNGLFGRFGVVCLDGDEPALKRLFAPVVQEELLNRVTYRTVNYANERIAGQYGEQAHVREINLFHLLPGRRSRIIPDGDRYRVLDDGPSFDLDQLLGELGAHPHRFSPNVLLRPVYQELVLPNIAYVGGGGELAYWLQLRWLFQGLRVPMPVLLLRTSAAFLQAKAIAQWKEAGLGINDLFAPLDGVKSAAAARRASFSTDMAQEHDQLNALYGQLAERAAGADPTLHAAVEARKTKAAKGLDAIGKALVRAAKREQEVLLQRIDRVHDAMFPGGGLQERRDNMLPMLATRGPELLDRLLEHLDPLDARFTVLVEE